MKKVVDRSAHLYEKAAKIIIDHFKKPSAFIYLMSSIADIIHENVKSGKGYNHDLDGMHFDIIDMMRTVSEPWIDGDIKGMASAFADIQKEETAHGYHCIILKALSAYSSNEIHFGVSREVNIVMMKNFQVLFEVGFLMDEAQNLDEDKDEKKAA